MSEYEIEIETTDGATIRVVIPREFIERYGDDVMSQVRAAIARAVDAVAGKHSWRGRFALARTEYARRLAESPSCSAETLFAALEPFWIRQYKETCELETNLIGADFHGYSFMTDNPGEFDEHAADRTIFVHGRSVEDVGFEPLLLKIEALLPKSDKASCNERDALIDRLGWLRWDHFEALSERKKPAYRQAEREIAVGLGLVPMLGAATRRYGPTTPPALGAALQAATGRDLAAGMDWFEAWARDAAPSVLDGLCRTLATVLGTPPLVPEEVLTTADGARCIALMRAQLAPLTKTFATKRPRGLQSRAHFRYPDRTAEFSLDVGHLAAHAAAGPPDINFFPQRRDFNRGRSHGGKVYRALEKYLASHPGTAYFSRLLFDSSTMGIPHFLELGLVAEPQAAREAIASIRVPQHGVELCEAAGAGAAVVVVVFDNYTGEVAGWEAPGDVVHEAVDDPG